MTAQQILEFCAFMAGVGFLILSFFLMFYHSFIKPMFPKEKNDKNK